MRKALIAGCIVASSLVVGGCAGQQASNPSPSSPPPSSSPPSSPPPSSPPPSSPPPSSSSSAQAQNVVVNTNIQQAINSINQAEGSPVIVAGDAPAVRGQVVVKPDVVADTDWENAALK